MQQTALVNGRLQVLNVALDRIPVFRGKKFQSTGKISLDWAESQLFVKKSSKAPDNRWCTSEK